MEKSWNCVFEFLRKQMEKVVGTPKTILIGLPQGSKHEVGC